MVLTYREVRALADVREQALTDELTGLANRRHLDQRLRELEESGQPFGVLLIDLDRFKEVNDSFGHGVGDDLLVAVAGRMTGEVDAAGGLLARMGGDEFGVVLPGADAAACSRVAASLHAALVESFAVGGMALHVEASLGVAVSPEHGTDAGELLRRADMAMYVAKRGHLGSHVFERGTEDDALVRLQTLEELRSALSRDEVVAHYQPQLDLRTGHILGVEALARWQHPERGLLGPGAFIDVAEQAGLVGPLFVRIARCALTDARRWLDRGLALEVSVNVSAHEVQDPTFPDTVASLLAEAGLPGSVLKVEVTESVLVSNPEHGRVVIDRLRDLGVRLSLDDFGTGYSSLSYLPSLPVQELKLDRSFIASLLTDPRTAAVVRSTLDLAHQLGLESVAEGIEDPEALGLLADWGCDVAQGYYIAKPMSADHLERWLTESPWLTGDVPLPVRGSRLS
jgi:diguanylate cyclase (GGDEF)-like protein